MTDEKRESILARYDSPDPPTPEERDPVRYERARVVAEAILARIQAQVNSAGQVKIRLDHPRVQEIMDATSWFLPKMILDLLKLDDKIRICNENRRAVIRGQVLAFPDGTPIETKTDRARAAAQIDEEMDYLEGTRTMVLGSMSASVRIWKYGERDERFLDTVGTLAIVFANLSSEAARHFRIRISRVLEDGTEVPIELPLLERPL